MIEVACRFVRLRQLHEIVCARRQPHGVIEIGNGARNVVLAHVNEATAGIELGIAGAEIDRLLKILQRALQVAEVAPHAGAAHIGRCRLRIELDGRVVIGGGFGVSAARIPGVAAVAVGRRKIGRQRSRQG